MLKKWVDDEPGKDMPNHNELADLCKRMGAEPVKRHNVRGWRGIGFDHVETEQSLPMGDE